MTELIPAFDWQQHVVAPWSSGLRPTLWIVLMGFFVATACGLIGNYLILRRMALVGDAISHSVLAGIGVVVALPFLVEQLPILNWIGLGNISGQLTTTAMFVGAVGAGVVTTLIIEVIHRYSRVKQDAAIGIAFTSLFAFGVILITVKSGDLHIDTDCVLYGEIIQIPVKPPRIEISPSFSDFIGKMPLFHVLLHGNELELAPSVVRMGIVALAVAILVWLFYKELLVSSFDSGLASSLGINATVVHYALMGLLSLVVVSAFESVGAILVVAMLILPGATAHLLSARLPVIMLLTVIHAFFSTLMGFHLATWLDCSIAGAFVVAGMGLFLLAWFFSPHDGLLGKWILSRKMDVKESSVEESEFVR
jgi:manganese/zinc/iron transport system permease protein